MNTCPSCGGVLTVQQATTLVLWFVQSKHGAGTEQRPRAAAVAFCSDCEFASEVTPGHGASARVK